MFPETHQGSPAPVWAAPGQTSGPASFQQDPPSDLADCSCCLHPCPPVWNTNTTEPIRTLHHPYRGPKRGLQLYIYLGFCLQKHRLPVLRLHLCFHWLVIFGGRLARQRIGQLNEDQLLRFAQAPSMQQVRENFGRGNRRRPESRLSLLYFNFLRFLFHCRQGQGLCDQTAKQINWVIGQPQVQNPTFTFNCRLHGFTVILFLLYFNRSTAKLVLESPSGHSEGELDRAAPLLAPQEGIIYKLKRMQSEMENLYKTA